MALPEATVSEIRRLKHAGASLRELAVQFGCAKSTVSLYCRDLFEYPRRKYHSEKEARQLPILNRRGKPRKRYPSDSAEHRRLHRRRYGHKPIYKCANCGSPVWRKGSLCIICYRQREKELALVREAKQAREREQRRGEKIERVMKRFPPPIIEVCPDSPNQRHYWKIDSNEHGVCQYCGEERDFIQGGVS